MRKKIISMGILLAAVTLLSACSGAGQLQNPANQSAAQTNTITVVGSGQAVGEPDQATIRLGHVARDSSVSAAIGTSNEVLRQMREAIQEQGVAAEDIQTTNFSIFTEESRFPEPDSSERPAGQRIYRVENTLTVTVRDIEQVGSVIEAALENGANNVHGLEFGLSGRDELAAEARSAAVQDARQRAQLLAEELGLTLGQVIEVKEQGSGGISPVREAAMGIGGAAPPISEGSLAVSAQVEITFALDQ